MNHCNHATAVGAGVVQKLLPPPSELGVVQKLWHRPPSVQELGRNVISGAVPTFVCILMEMSGRLLEVTDKSRKERHGGKSHGKKSLEKKS